ncbi:MAG: hypothetical protein C4339_06780 [Nitrososphaerota archaeon]
MKLEGCEFPEQLLYDVELMAWARVEGEALRIGITSTFAALAGRLERLTLKPRGTRISRGGALGGLEGPRYFGLARSPVSGIIEEINDEALRRPKLVNDYPYTLGWLVRLVRFDHREVAGLRPLQACKEELLEQVRRLRVRCFSAFPDYEMFEIGLECAAVLPKLDELMAKISPGEVVHLVSDDPTAPIEMVRWASQRGQELLEVTKEGNLFHIIVRKAK